MQSSLDYDGLRRDLIDYYGIAMAGPFPMAMIDLIKVEQATNEQLVNMALNEKIDLANYIPQS